MTSRKEYRIKLISKEFLNSDTCYLGFECPEIANNSQPGQFVNISAGTVFLKRPFGIASVDKEKGTFNIGVKVVGKGTKEISEFETGMMVDCLGPLGNGFDFGSYDNIILTGGGTGVFPINYAYETLIAQGKNVTVCEGFRCKDQVILNKEGYVLTTDSGDTGIKGTVIAGLDTIDIADPSKTLICCVGPIPMMKAVSIWAEGKGMNCLVSMEQRMACGAGICLCCTVKVKDDGPDGYKNVRCCKEGPVFDSKEVVW